MKNTISLIIATTSHVRAKLAILNNELRDRTLDLTPANKTEIREDIKILNISINELIHHIDK